MFSWYPSMENMVFASSIRRSISGSIITTDSSILFSPSMGYSDLDFRIVAEDTNFELLMATENLFRNVYFTICKIV